ncbi:protein sprouty homolog 2 [Halichoeres trimaculatus]|uniref:protein sprouty homolog 2 n=1 Tax=Halichoeres trimaculatus TaxID=147232 RepID=UPI003D9E7A65
MDSRSQNDSERGGGHHGWTTSATRSLERQLGEEGSPQPPTAQDSPRAAHTSAVLSLDQIRITGSSNEYTEGPTVAQRSPASQLRHQKSDSTASRSSGQETQEERQNNLLNLQSLTHHGDTHTSVSSEDSQSVTSGQRLLSSPAGGSQIIRTQPPRTEVISEELKPLNNESRPVTAVPGSFKSHPHSNKCDDCGRCCCAECRRPRVLPSCWMCGRRCVCSLQNVVEYGTCACCIKGLFYHCSSDDEDTCADKPFSCTQQRCCVRWTAVSLFSLLFPCLLCYLPAKGCLAVCQSCYDRVSRPGCRCKKPKPCPL